MSAQDWERLYKRMRTQMQEQRQRAEQAEREREETLRMWREYKAAKDADVASADGARERAEADNAALLEGIRKAVRHLREDGSPRECWCGAEEGTNVEEHDSTCAAQFLEPRVGGPLMGGDHPGAALLEEIRRTTACRACNHQRHDGVTCSVGACLCGQSHSRVTDLQYVVSEMEKNRNESIDITTRREYALLERIRALEDVVAKFREVEWARGDWQGFCPFRRHKNVVCLGTDGHVAPVGTPAPVPHSEHCPFHALNALKEAP